MSDPRGEETHWEWMTYSERLYCFVLGAADDRGRKQVKGTVQSACVRVFVYGCGRIWPKSKQTVQGRSRLSAAR